VFEKSVLGEDFKNCLQIEKLQNVSGASFFRTELFRCSKNSLIIKVFRNLKSSVNVVLNKYYSFLCIPFLL